MGKLRAAVLILAGVIATAGLALAHHSFTAEFNGNKEVTVTGVLTKIDWINPHVYLYMDVKDANGKVTSWAFETLPTGFLHRMGVTRDLFVEGQTLTVEGYAAKDESKNLAQIKDVIFPDGHKYVMFIYQPK